MGEKPLDSGDPGGSRTPNPQIRSLMLYPVELRGRVKFSVEKQFTPNLSSHFVITESERIHMRVSPICPPILRGMGLQLTIPPGSLKLLVSL